MLGSNTIFLMSSKNKNKNKNIYLSFRAITYMNMKTGYGEYI